MNNNERGKMYCNIQSLKEIGLNVSPIARKLGIPSTGNRKNQTIGNSC
jgi:hypothetical protein